MNSLDLKNDEFIIDFFYKIEASKNTQKMYIQALKHYTEIAGKSPRELIEDAEREVTEGKLMRERNLNRYLTAYKKFIEDQGFAPKTRNAFISGVKTFYKTYDLQLPNHVKTKKAQPLKENAINGFLKRETIIGMLNNAASQRDRGIILTMVSSGMSMNELRNLRVKDIKDIDEQGIGRLFLCREKVADVVEPYYCFLTPEATEAIKNYLDERNRSDITRVKGEDDFLFVNYQNGEQLEERLFHFIFQQLGVKLGFITKTVRYGVNPLSSHKLRKYYSNILKNEEVVDEGFIDYTMGHVTPAVQQAYHQADPEKLKTKYLRCLPYLTFLRNIKPLVVESDGYKKLREENEKLKTRLDEMEQQRKKDMGLNEDMINAMIEARVKEILNKK